MSMIDFESFTPKAKNSGNIVFVRAKTCPTTFKPVGKLLPYVAVYDEQLKKNRVPKAGEKASTRYMVNGIDLDGTVKVYDLSSTTVESIKAVRYTLAKKRISPEIYVTITASGAGTDTKYAAEPADVPEGHDARTASPEQMHDLAATRDKIVAPAEPVDDEKDTWATK